MTRKCVVGKRAKHQLVTSAFSIAQGRKATIGVGVRGAASATALEFKLGGSAMMKKDFNILLVQQPGNTPICNILDLTTWQASQLEVDKMNGAGRHREPELVEVCKHAWAATPDVKALRAFEVRRGCARESIETDGWCPQEGKGKEGAHRVHVDASYAQLRARLRIPDS